ncbi:MAG: hypothetical protein ABSE73_24675, partial [Planctomycetota bacterium]
VETSRRRGDGLKQAALLALVRVHLASDQAAQAGAAAADFRILYPLDSSGPVAREIARLLHARLLSQASAAFLAGQYQAAVEAYDAWLGFRGHDPISGRLEIGIVSPESPNAEQLSVRLNLIKALLSLKNGARARHEAAALAAVIPPERKAELDALSAQAEALPGAAEKPLLPMPRP